MRITKKILSIPPYISTSWKNVVSLHIEKRSDNPLLIIGLVNGSTIEIPNLDPAALTSVFKAHEKYLEQDMPLPPSPEKPSTVLPESLADGGSTILSLPLDLGLNTNMGNFLEHNSETADAPDLPKDIIDKIVELSKVIDLDNLENLSNPEPHCNCMHCQIMRAIRKEEEPCAEEFIEEEEVSDDDLQFREWDIKQTGEKLYAISNPFDKNEQFNVFLGSPVGCTCGKPNCEHIRAILNS